MSDNVTPSLTKWQFEVISALKEATDHPEGPGNSPHDSSRGWFLASQLSDKNLVNGPNIRPALLALCDARLVESTFRSSGRYFRLTNSGVRRLEEGYSEVENPMSVDSSNWTGIIEPVRVYQALAILNEMEDACEQIENNHDRSQIFGLIRALEVLLNLPEPPRQGIVSLVRDPAFANLVQVATFLAALLAALRP